MVGAGGVKGERDGLGGACIIKEEIVIKIAMVGIIVAVLSQLLSRAGRDDYALITVLAGIAAVLIMLLPYLSQLLDAVNGMLGG